VAFPFRNVAEQDERRSIAKYLVHSQHVVDTALRAIKEISSVNLMCVHWRYGEDSCGWYNSPDPQYDFCWGTTVFHFAKIVDIVTVLQQAIKDFQVSSVYLAVAAHYEDPAVFPKLDEGLRGINTPLYRFSRVESLVNATVPQDNYYSSLYEQELCTRSKFFIRSSDSTWSDNIVAYIEATGNPYGTQIYSFDQLLKKHNLPFSTWHRESQESQLKKFRKS